MNLILIFVNSLFWYVVDNFVIGSGERSSPHPSFWAVEMKRCRKSGVSLYRLLLLIPIINKVEIFHTPRGPRPSQCLVPFNPTSHPIMHHIMLKISHTSCYPIMHSSVTCHVIPSCYTIILNIGHIIMHPSCIHSNFFILQTYHLREIQIIYIGSFF